MLQLICPCRDNLVDQSLVLELRKIIPILILSRFDHKFYDGNYNCNDATNQHVLQSTFDNMTLRR